MSSIQATIREQPWMEEKEKLISRLADINRRGEGGWERYQQEADATVRAIGSEVRVKVVYPLSEFLTDDPLAGELMPELTGELKTFPEAIDGWIEGNLGRRWYRTIKSKGEEVEYLTRSLQTKLNLISSKIRLEQPNLMAKREELTEQISMLENDPNIREKEEKLKKLEAEMQKILPEWIQGMISVEQMIQLYPFIILGLVVYVIGMALSLTKHYQYMAHGWGLTKAGGADPVLSSLWTLTYRGRIGTTLTLVTYLAFVVAMWFFFEMGSAIFVKWLKTEGTGILDAGSLKMIYWLCRLILISLVGFIALQPFYHKNRFATEK